MEYRNQKKKIKLAGTFTEIARRNTSKTIVYESLREVKKPRGKSKLTSLIPINNDLKCVALHTNDITELLRIANDRQTRSGIITVAISRTDELA